MSTCDAHDLMVSTLQDVKASNKEGVREIKDEIKAMGNTLTKKMEALQDLHKEEIDSVRRLAGAAMGKAKQAHEIASQPVPVSEPTQVVADVETKEQVTYWRGSLAVLKWIVITVVPVITGYLGWWLKGGAK